MNKKSLAHKPRSQSKKELTHHFERANCQINITMIKERETKEEDNMSEQQTTMRAKALSSVVMMRQEEKTIT